MVKVPWYRYQTNIIIVILFRVVKQVFGRIEEIQFVEY